LAVLVAACGGSGVKTVVRTAPAAVAPSRTPVTLTGTEVDQVLGAAIAVDDIELAGLAGYQRVSCKKGSAEGSGEPPICRDNESDDTSVEVLPSSACSDGWVRPEQAPDAFRFALQAKPELLAVAKPHIAPTVFGGGFGAEEVAIFRTGTHAEGQPSGVALHIKSGRVVWIEADCHNLFELVAPEKVDSFVFDPKGIATPSSPVSPAP
jgi:hypothetical protein